MQCASLCLCVHARVCLCECICVSVLFLAVILDMTLGKDSLLTVVSFSAWPLLKDFSCIH